MIQENGLLMNVLYSEEIKRTGETIIKWAKEGAAKGPAHQMCNSCAFKNGTEANQDSIVILAAQMVYSSGTFLCHETEGETTCAGFLNARNLEK